MKIPKFLKGKVYVNKRTKQKTIVLSSKEIKRFGKKLPKNKEVKITW